VQTWALRDSVRDVGGKRGADAGSKVGGGATAGAAAADDQAVAPALHRVLFYGSVMPTTRLAVNAAAGSYSVVVGTGALDELPALLDAEGLGSHRVIASSPAVWDLHRARFARLQRGGVADPILVPDGERWKTIQTVGRVYEALIRAGADRSVVILAVGGGVIGDLVGFAAATYLRGVRLVQIPTTLLAQVDSAIGGKVGVNHPLGKNLIGAFHPPRLVVSDPAVLATLGRRDFRAGLYEVIKYGIIASPPLLERVRVDRDRLFACDAASIEAVVIESTRIKAEIVSSDEREQGRRRVLNFGHTIGHALEAVTEYRRFRHGEAIAYGMIGAAVLGRNRGVTPPDAAAEIRQAITALGPLPPLSDLRSADVVAAMRRDKKVVGGTLHFVAATRLGATTEITDVTEKQVKEALGELGLRP
jgi:3-dehydroquinate synthase